MRFVLALVMSVFTTVALAAPYELEGSFVRLSSPVTFESNSDRLTPEGEAALAGLKAYLDDKSYISTLRIEGHTDATGGSEHNQKLSEARALSIARWLVHQGVDCTRVLPVGFGETKPVAPNDTPEDRAKNRRMEFVNAALRGHAIGGMPLDGGGVVAGDPCK